MLWISIRRAVLKKKKKSYVRSECESRSGDFKSGCTGPMTVLWRHDGLAAPWRSCGAWHRTNGFRNGEHNKSWHVSQFPATRHVFFQSLNIWIDANNCANNQWRAQLWERVWSVQLAESKTNTDCWGLFSVQTFLMCIETIIKRSSDFIPISLFPSSVSSFF